MPGPPRAAARCHVRGGLGWIPGADPPAFTVAQLFLNAGSPRPGRPVSRPVSCLHLLHPQQIFTEHVRQAPETQRGGTGGVRRGPRTELLFPQRRQK